jgi:hypothetical protein
MYISHFVFWREYVFKIKTMYEYQSGKGDETFTEGHISTS